MDVFKNTTTLIIDGDTILYRSCAVLNEDHPTARKNTARNIRQTISGLCAASGCTEYILLLTGKKNYRNFITDDYKENRKGLERPVNLAWSKQWAIKELNAELVEGVEADDLVAVVSTQMPCIIWSVDKDIRQIPGYHFDDKTYGIVKITEKGYVKSKSDFTGLLGFYYQMLVGDSGDYIVGCGNRVENTYRSGTKEGQKYTRRKGVGPKEAIKILNNAECPKEAVTNAYKLMFGDKFQEKMEQQAALLWMSRELYGTKAKLWTLDGRDRYIDILSGEISDAIPDTEQRYSPIQEDVCGEMQI